MLKRILSFIIIANLLVYTAGCGTTSSTVPENNNQPSAPEASQQDQQSQPEQLTQPEAVKADQNAAKPDIRNDSGANNYASNENYVPSKITFLTEDDLQKVLRLLIKRGYLAEASINQKNFAAALSQYQNDQGLKPTGQLDAETLKQLGSESQ